MIYQIENFFLNLLLVLIWMVPISWIQVIGGFFGRLLYLTGIRKRIVMINLEIAFDNELSKNEQKKLCKKIYYNFGVIFLEILKMRFLPADKLRKRIKLIDAEVLNELNSQQEGGIITSFHQANFIAIPAGIAMASPVPFYSLLKEQKNPHFDEFCRKLLSRFSVEPVTKTKNTGRTLYKLIKDKKLVGILNDQNVPHKNLFVNFFNKQAAIGQGPPRIVARLKCPLFFSWIKRVGNFQYQIYFKKIDYSLTNDEEQNIKQIAQMISDNIEDKIRDSPESFFWFNKRWKTRPLEEDTIDLYGKPSK